MYYFVLIECQFEKNYLFLWFDVIFFGIVNSAYWTFY